MTLMALDGLLDSERHAIRAGAFQGLDRLAVEKERLLEAISRAAGGVTRVELAALKAKAARNQRLLAAAIKGVRAAQRRLQMIQRASRSMTTYDSLGHCQEIGADPGTVERRS